MLRTAVVGLGRMGRIHLANASRHPSLNVVTACSVRMEDQEWLKQAHPNVDFQPSLEKLFLNHQDLDVIFLVTPSDQHVKQIRSCVEYGVHIFCEKPLATDEVGCLTLEELQRDHPDKHLMAGFMRRFDPSYLKMHQLLLSEEIGAPILFRSYSADPDHAIASYLDYAAHGGGHFLDMSIHDIDLMHWLVGGRPVRVMTTGGSYKYPQLSKYGGDNATALIELDNGVTAFLYTGRTAAHGYLVETEIIGTEGTVSVGRRPDADLVELRSSGGARATFAQDFTERFATAFIGELDYFVNCIESGQSVSPSWSEGIAATRTALRLEDDYAKRLNF